MIEGSNVLQDLDQVLSAQLAGSTASRNELRQAQVAHGFSSALPQQAGFEQHSPSRPAQRGRHDGRTDSVKLDEENAKRPERPRPAGWAGLIFAMS